MAFKSRSDLVGKRFLCIYATNCSDHHSDTNNNSSKTANSNQSQTTAQNLTKQQLDKQRSSKDCTEKCFNTVHKLKSTRIQDWPWRSGIIRASSHRDALHSDLSVSFLCVLLMCPTSESTSESIDRSSTDSYR